MREKRSCLEVGFAPLCFIVDARIKRVVILILLLFFTILSGSKSAKAAGNEIISFEVEDIHISEDEGYIEVDWETQESYLVYPVFESDRTLVAIETADGKKYQGTLYDVLQDLNNDEKYYYYIEHIGSGENTSKTWEPGEHKCGIVLGRSDIPEVQSSDDAKYTANFSVLLSPGIIESIYVEDYILSEDLKAIDNIEEDGNKSLYNYYNFIPGWTGNLHVKTSNGKEYSGFEWEINDILEQEYGVRIEEHICFEDTESSRSGKPGEYIVFCNFGKAVTSYTVTIKPRIIDSVIAEDLTIYEDEIVNTYGWIEGLTDETIYNLRPRNIKVSTSNGETYSGYLDTVWNDIVNDTGLTIPMDSRPVDWKWGDPSGDFKYLENGEYEYTFRLGQASDTYRIQILPSIIGSLVIEDPVRTTDDFGEIKVYVDEQTILSYYDVTPRITVMLTDGEVVKGSPLEVNEIINEQYSFFPLKGIKHTQDPNNPWGKGEYPCLLLFGNRKYEYNVNIIDPEVFEPDKEIMSEAAGISEKNREVIVSKLRDRNDVPKDIYEQIGTELKLDEESYSIVYQYDITLYSALMDTAGNEIQGSRQFITELSTPIPMTFVTPGTEGKEYCVIRKHMLSDGREEITRLETTDNGDGTVTVMTDRFSMYYLAEIDADAYLAGDITGDGKVNIFDVVRLLKKTTGEDVQTFANPDVTGDGKINIFDVVRLLKFVSGEKVEIH